MAIPDESEIQKEKAEGLSIVNIYSASQTRLDNWNELKTVTDRLDEKHIDEELVLKLTRKAHKLLHKLEPIEMYWAFPGRNVFKELLEILAAGDFHKTNNVVKRIVRALMNNSYRRRRINLGLMPEDKCNSLIESEDNRDNDKNQINNPYFEVLIVDNNSGLTEENERAEFAEIRRYSDAFTYEPVFVHSFEDALIASLVNHNIQAIVVRYGFELESEYGVSILNDGVTKLTKKGLKAIGSGNYAPTLCDVIKKVRPELDIYLVTDRSVEEVASTVTHSCRRVFYNQEDYLELHLNILRGVQERYQSPFFSALKKYSKQPTGVFHAMPISRGKSITKSHWIKDMAEFYGMNTFLAETSATSGGLDSLLDPTGPIKEALLLAARAFGARQTFFATNGTSTCNKIVVQALTRPGDIVLVDRDCHKSHHYGMVLAGSEVIYLDSYPLDKYSMYGAVPLEDIKRTLLELKQAGKLDRVKMLLLTNCTFDGLVYNVKRIMEQCLAIKPDLVFLWDEAWFAFARFGPTYRQRTGMHAAQLLRNKYRSKNYRKDYVKHLEELAAIDPNDIETLAKMPLLPDPDLVRIRVYATQSTHKTLTSLRQGSMIHIYDQDYNGKAEESFHEAYMTHTSTSPNYQILASLDIGRRQVELEGFELVQKQVEMATVLRKQITKNTLLSKYFKVLGVNDMIPQKYRTSDKEYYSAESNWGDIWDSWINDEFVLDATRITLYVASLGVDGDTFKNKYLMDQFGIQINKTSRNTVLFMTNIGTTRSSIAYLLEALIQIAKEMDSKLDHASKIERLIHDKKVYSLTEKLPPLPDFSYFHDVFRPDPTSNTQEGHIRSAFYLSYDDENCEYFSIENEIEEVMSTGRELVSAGFITPYPPGFPILVPGQVISKDIMDFMRNLDVKEIHGYREELGLRVFTQPTLDNFKLRQ